MGKIEKIESHNVQIPPFVDPIDSPGRNFFFSLVWANEVEGISLPVLHCNVTNYRFSVYINIL